MLDRESRNLLLDSDQSYGGMREPLIKVVSVLRSLAYKQTSIHFASLYHLDSIIGQSPHDLPSVFSFFLPEYVSTTLFFKSLCFRWNNDFHEMLLILTKY